MRSGATCSVILLTALAGAGCTSEKSVTVTDTMGRATEPARVEALPAIAPAPYDLQFIDTMILHQQGATEMATLAGSRLQNEKLKELARNIPSNQKREIGLMKAWRKEWYPGALPAENMLMPGMGGAMMDMANMKNAPSGPAFDAMFIDMMIPHHQGAVQMGENALAKAGRPELKELAKKIIDAQTREIEEMKKLRPKLPNPPESNEQ